MGHSPENHIIFSILKNVLSSIGKIFNIDFFQNFIFFTERSREYVKSDHIFLNKSTVTGKWFRKFVFNFNLTGVFGGISQQFVSFN